MQVTAVLSVYPKVGIAIEPFCLGIVSLGAYDEGFRVAKRRDFVKTSVFNVVEHIFATLFRGEEYRHVVRDCLSLTFLCKIFLAHYLHTLDNKGEEKRPAEDGAKEERPA